MHRCSSIFRENRSAVRITASHFLFLCFPTFHNIRLLANSTTWPKEVLAGRGEAGGRGQACSSASVGFLVLLPFSQTPLERLLLKVLKASTKTQLAPVSSLSGPICRFQNLIPGQQPWFLGESPACLVPSDPKEFYMHGPAGSFHATTEQHLYQAGSHKPDL